MGLFKKIKNEVKKAARAVASAVRQVTNLIAEVVQRVLGIPEFIANLLGFMPFKIMR